MWHILYKQAFTAFLSNITMEKTLLLIDDDPDDIEMFCDAVQEIDEKNNCLCASNGREALEIVNSCLQKPDYIFLDLNMPQMNGKQCVKEIKQHSEFAEIPVIIYSTSKYKKEIDEIPAIGAAIFLTKPTLFNDLKIAIAEVIIKKLENISGGT
jgi:CheY-like chemotaxis protein